MVYGYARVSTRGQARDGNGLEAQEQALRQAGAEEIYTDAWTGTQSKRPGLNDLLNKIQAGDVLVVSKLDRIARSAVQGSALVEDLIKRGVTVNILNMGTMDDSPAGRLIRHVMFSFAEFEHDLIITRTQEGKEIARRRAGYKEGRPRAFTNEQRQLAVELLKTHSYSQVVRMTGLSKSTIIRAKREGA